MAEPTDAERTELVTRRYTRGIAIAAVAILALWHLCTDLTATISGWSQYRYPTAVGAAWVAFTALGIGYSTALLRGRPPRSWRWPAAVALVLISLAVHLGNTRDTYFERTNWGWGAIGWLALVVYWRRPVRGLVPVLAANAAVTLAVLIWDGQAGPSGMSRYLMGVTVVYVLQFGSAGGVQALLGAAGRIAASSAARGRELAARAAGDQVHLVRRQRYEALRTGTATLLADLAYGAADPGSGEVQHLCAGEAARLRRLMVEGDDVPDPLLHELRACADIAERKGVVVDLVMVGQIPALPVAVRRALAEPPIALLAGARSRARITVAATSSGVTVGVLADAVLAGPQPPSQPPSQPSPQDQSPAVTVQWDRDDDMWWVQTSAAA